MKILYVDIICRCNVWCNNSIFPTVSYANLSTLAIHRRCARDPLEQITERCQLQLVTGRWDMRTWLKYGQILTCLFVSLIYYSDFPKETPEMKFWLHVFFVQSQITVKSLTCTHDIMLLTKRSTASRDNKYTSSGRPSGLKMERKNTSKCLGGPRMEDEGVRNAQTFLVKNFLSFNWSKNTMIWAFSSKFWIHGFKAPSWTLENKDCNVQY